MPRREVPLVVFTRGEFKPLVAVSEDLSPSNCSEQWGCDFCAIRPETMYIYIYIAKTSQGHKLTLDMSSKNREL
jgi:hypothetical protein